MKIKNPLAKICERKANLIRDDKFILQKLDYKKIKDVEGNYFSPLVKEIIDGNGCMINSRAGCGKTYLINELKTSLDLL